MTTIGVMLLTYERLDYALETLDHVHRNLTYDGPMRLHISDDGSSQEYRDCLAAAAQGGRWEAVTISNAERRGYGASYNLGTLALHTDCEIILPLEDDWRLERELDLTPMVRGLLAGVFSSVRMGYLGWTQDLRGTFMRWEGDAYVLLDPESPEPHVASGHPRLETREYERRVGLWTEGLPGGATEWDWCRRIEARQGVAWPVDLIKTTGNLWGHFGTRTVRGD